MHRVVEETSFMKCFCSKIKSVFSIHFVFYIIWLPKIIYQQKSGSRISNKHKSYFWNKLENYSKNNSTFFFV